MPAAGRLPLRSRLSAREGRCWGAFPHPLKALWLFLLGLRDWPLPSAYSIVSANPVAVNSGAGGGKGEGREGTGEEE